MVPLLPRGQSCTFRWVLGQAAVVANSCAVTTPVLRGFLKALSSFTSVGYQQKRINRSIQFSLCLK